MCNSSTPVALDGQLCYNIKLDMKSENGKKGGLSLVLDMNEDRCVDFQSLVRSYVQEDDSKIALKSELKSADRTGKVYVHLLSPFEGSAEGSYSLKSVKKIKGTTDFLDMPKTDRECVHETTEACMKRNLLEECHCAPWELANVQVIGCIIIDYHILSCTGTSNLFCGRERVSHEDTGYAEKLQGELL